MMTSDDLWWQVAADTKYADAIVALDDFISKASPEQVEQIATTLRGGQGAGRRGEHMHAGEELDSETTLRGGKGAAASAAVPSVGSSRQQRRAEAKAEAKAGAPAAAPKGGFGGSAAPRVSKSAKGPRRASAGS
jgi:hypothetical protein